MMSAEDLQRVLGVALADYPQYYPLILFLADTGVRFGEACAIRWADVDLESGTARIARSFSSGVRLGPTKTGRVRIVELSTRLQIVLRQIEPNVYPIPEESLVFPNQSGDFLRGTHFRARVFSQVVKKALGVGWHYSPHSLRHTWVSLHMARGTPLKWIQEQGGWTTAKVLLDTYGHFMPTESRGFADALTTLDGPYAVPGKNGMLVDAPDQPATHDLPRGSEISLVPTSPRSPIMHFEPFVPEIAIEFEGLRRPATLARGTTCAQ